MKRKICIITGSRAEYGLLKPLIEEIKNDSAFKLQLLATGMHLSPEFGLTYQEIEKDGFRIDEKVEILLSSDTPIGVSKSMGLAMISFAEVYARLKPDLILGLGDRFELFSAVASALVSRIPVAQLSAGDITEGTFDDSFRHCITKMSQLHFTTTEEYRQRVIQMGEAPRRVFNVGALALDNIRNLSFLSKKSLEQELNFKFNKHNLLVTFHPLTLERNTARDDFQNLLDVLDELKDTNIIFTKANADTGGRIINKMIDDYTAKRENKCVEFISLGQLKYLSAMRFVDAVVGNSSSGIEEAPSLKIGTINIGNRQNGRIKVRSIIDCSPTKTGIRNAFIKLYSKNFKKILKSIENPYGDGNTAKRIKDILKRENLEQILMKKFYDLRAKPIKRK